MRKLLHYSFLMFSAAALLAGCSDSNVESGEDVHPANWYQLHGSTTSVATYPVDCGGCHVVVANQPGPASPPSCFSADFNGQSCHATGPGVPHPLDGSFLQGSVHGKVAKADLTVCQRCHSDNPNGGPGSNPRFNVGIDNTLAPAPGTGCEQCHQPNHAHPSQAEGPGVRWAGPNVNNTFHYSSGNIQAACTLCHGVNLDGVGGAGGIAINCQRCHAETTNFTLKCDACHNFPLPGTSPELEIAALGGVLVPHTTTMIGNHNQCATCHGVRNSEPALTTGSLSPSANYLSFNKTTDTIGDHWNGQINMNSALQYDETQFGCLGACHTPPIDATHVLSDSQLPVASGDYGSGGAPHAVGDNWLRLTQHATQAVNVTLDCVGCHTQTGGGIDPPCQGCHKVAPLMNLTTAGCPSCHSYPPDGATPVATQPNRAGTHAAHNALAGVNGVCETCHQGSGSDSPTHYDRIDVTTPNPPAEVSFLATYNAQSGAATYSTAAQTCGTVRCHGGVTTPDWYTGTLPTTDPAVSNEFCLSCHKSSGEFNSFSSGDHGFHVQFFRCVQCHDTTVLQNGVGGAGPTHWSNLDTTAFELLPANTVGGGATRIASYVAPSCTPDGAPGCHGTRNW